MKLPFIISVPHCSGKIPDGVRTGLALTEEEIAQSTDIGTEELFGALPAREVLTSRWSRLVVDLNRSPRERGPKGVIAQIDYHGRRVYRPGCLPDKRELERRLELYYLPYHNRLRAALSDPQTKALLDCHSLNGTGPREAPDPGVKRKDIILGNNGDRQGNQDPALGPLTCPPQILMLMKDAFQEAGFSVSLNSPYAGGFITVHYGKILGDQGKVAVQIEINQDLYVDRTGMNPVPEKLRQIRSRLMKAFSRVASLLGERD